MAEDTPRTGTTDTKTEQHVATGTTPEQPAIAPSPLGIATPTAPYTTEKAVEESTAAPLPHISGTHQGGVQRSAFEGDIMAGTRTAEGHPTAPTSTHSTEASKIAGQPVSATGNLAEPVQAGNQQATTDPQKAENALEQAASDANPASASTQPDAGKQ